MVLRLDEDGSEDAYVNTAAGANYINASYVDVCGFTVFCFGTCNYFRFIVLGLSSSRRFYSDSRTAEEHRGRLLENGVGTEYVFNCESNSTCGG